MMLVIVFGSPQLLLKLEAMFLIKDFVSLRVTDVVPCTAPMALMMR
jgi:hypothetical protein